MHTHYIKLLLTDKHSFADFVAPVSIFPNTINRDAATLMKPFLAQGKLRCIGCSTFEDFKNSVEKDGALARHFSSVSTIVSLGCLVYLNLLPPYQLPSSHLKGLCLRTNRPRNS